MRKQAYQDKLRRQVRQWQASIDGLKDRLKQASADTRRELEHRIQDLQAKQQAARRKLEQLDRTSESTLERVRRPAESALYGARRAIRRIVSGFK